MNIPHGISWITPTLPARLLVAFLRGGLLTAEEKRERVGEGEREGWGVWGG